MNINKELHGIPSELRKIQEWFGSIISHPIDEDGYIRSLTPSGRSIEEEACLYIVPSQTLRPSQRIQIYNQQYWWRLLRALQNSLPLVTRLFGSFAFNKKLGIPFLLKHPPNHWSLSSLTDQFVPWLEEEYQSKNKPLIIDAAKIDLGFISGSLSLLYPPLLSEDLASDEISEKIIFVQPHLHFFEGIDDLFALRKTLLKESADYWIAHKRPNPTPRKSGCFILYRTWNHDMAWEEIEKEEFDVLVKFKDGTTIENLCEWLTQNEQLCGIAEMHFQNWFQKWSARQWLCYRIEGG